MRIFSVVLLLVHALVVSRLVGGAAVDRYESDRQRHRAVFKFLDTTKDQRADDESRSAAATTAEYGQKGEEEEEEYDDDEYYDDEYEDGMSGDYEIELPQVAMSSKPKDPSAILVPETTQGQRRKGKGRKKGKGKKRNPCLKKYKDFCIHGTCQYLRDLRAPACVCHPSYSGERCQFFTLPVEKPQEGYNRTTALAVVAVVLSSICLTIIGLLLLLRFHKRGAYDVENEEKVKLGLAANH